MTGKTRVSELLVYRRLTKEKLFADVIRLLENTGGAASEELRGLYFSCAGGLLEMAGKCGFCGNLWHTYLAYLLVNDENDFSMACEVSGRAGESVSEAVLHDFEILRGLFACGFGEIEETLGVSAFTRYAADYRQEGGGRMFSEKVKNRICRLAESLAQTADAQEFREHMAAFYREFGVGKLGLHKAFRIESGPSGAQIVPITNIAPVQLSDLVGYENAKKKLIANTEAFVSGRRANNCLLYGDAGTGKSSSIKGILNAYYGRGLRMIEVYKHQFRDLNSVVAQIKNRNYKFIIYMDDLSFEDFEIEYKYLKAVIEGGLEKKPENVLIYATSNRRHLVRERFSDKKERDDELHTSDTVQEKLSLASRFGVQIFFGAPEKKEYQEIVRTLAAREGVSLSQEELLLLANQWELGHGGRSGRTARQFIDDLMGKGLCRPKEG